MAANRMLSAIAMHEALHPPHGMAAHLPRGATGIGGGMGGGMGGILDRLTGSPLGQIGLALLAGGGGGLGNAAAMLMQMGAANRAATMPKLEHIGNQLGFIDPQTGEFTPTYTEPQQPTELEREITLAGGDPHDAGSQALIAQILHNRADPIVTIPLGDGRVYMGPRSGMQDAISGSQAPASTPAAAAPTAAPSAPGSLAPAVARVESRNRDFGPNGTPITSSKGALYAMQVLPSTAHNPGYGVTPAANDSAAEYDRVGRDYLAALTKHYGGNTAEALAAYNAGPGTVDKAIASGAPLPSQGYVNKVMGGASSAQSDIVTQAHQAIAAGADPDAVRQRALSMGVTLP